MVVMKTSFRRCRICTRIAVALMALALLTALACNLVGDAEAAVMGDVAGLAIAFVAAGFGFVAYASLKCPQCGRPVVNPKRMSFAVENRSRFQSVRKRQPLTCIHCGAAVGTD